MTGTLVLVRHGQSEWNLKNIFTGFVDVDLSKHGEDEARRAQKALAHYKFDAVFTSALKRAQRTAWIILGENKPQDVFMDAALNERHYGELQGQNKDDMRKKYGVEQVHIWRRSFDVRPPGGESLKDTCERVVPYFENEIKPRLLAGQTILVSAHGNSLRALIKYLENISEEEIVGLEIPTGVPIVYNLDDKLTIVKKTVLAI